MIKISVGFCVAVALCAGLSWELRRVGVPEAWSIAAGWAVLPVVGAAIGFGLNRRSER